MITPKAPTAAIIFDGDANACAEWVPYARAQMSAMRGATPGTKSRVMSPKDGVEIRLCAVTNTIFIKSGRYLVIVFDPVSPNPGGSYAYFQNNAVASYTADLANLFSVSDLDAGITTGLYSGYYAYSENAIGGIVAPVRRFLRLFGDIDLAKDLYEHPGDYLVYANDLLMDLSTDSDSEKRWTVNYDGDTLRQMRVTMQWRTDVQWPTAFNIELLGSVEKYATARTPTLGNPYTWEGRYNVHVPPKSITIRIYKKNALSEKGEMICGFHLNFLTETLEMEYAVGVKPVKEVLFENPNTGEEWSIRGNFVAKLNGTIVSAKPISKKALLNYL